MRPQLWIVFRAFFNFLGRDMMIPFALLEDYVSTSSSASGTTVDEGRGWQRVSQRAFDSLLEQLKDSSAY